MIEDAKFCAREFGGVHDAGMNEFIEDEDVVLAHQRGNGAERRGVTGRKGQRGFGAFEGGERFLQFVEWCERTADQPGRARARAKLVAALDAGQVQDISEVRRESGG